MCVKEEFCCIMKFRFDGVNIKECPNIKKNLYEQPSVGK
jgi:hypothetical protein